MINGIAVGNNAGYSVTSAVDINEDWINDIVIGARYADLSSRTNAEQVYLMFAKPSLLSF
ncbi:MAG: integrin alpha [Candidatus Midichloria sp.]